MPTLPSWPSYVSILNTGYSIQRHPKVRRTPMETGPAVQQTDNARTMVQTTLAIRLASKVDYAAFVAWVRDDLKRGVAWFNWTDPADGITKEARIIGGNIDYTPVRRDMELWKATLTLEFWES